jgi:hypothetical protein
MRAGNFDAINKVPNRASSNAAQWFFNFGHVCLSSETGGSCVAPCEEEYA